VTFTATVQDDVPDNVKRVAVLYAPEGSGDWTLLDLVLDPVSDRWTGAALVDGAVQYTLYALDGAGNVGLSTNKGQFHRTIEAPTPSGIAVAVAGTAASGGWLFDATVTITGPENVLITYKVDNGPAAQYTGPFSVSGTGIHIVSAIGTDGSSGGAIVPLDNADPTVSLVAPFDGVTYLRGEQVQADYLCLDAGSGVDSCSGPVAPSDLIDTSTPGVNEFMVDVTDVAGNVSSSATYYFIVCATDEDCDGVASVSDNCPLDPNPLQENFDAGPLDNGPGTVGDDETVPNEDHIGDTCDDDDDNDGILDFDDVNPLMSVEACGILAGSSDGHAMPDGGDNSYSDGDPSSWDTDGDGVRDGAECVVGTDPRMPTLSDRNACIAATGLSDSDHDGLLDDWEFCGWGTDPLQPNTDGDDLGDCVEVMDVNGNGVVTHADAVLVRQDVFGVSIGDRASMDINRSAVLTNADAAFIQQAVFGLVVCL
jgi:hypothetical protein